MNNYTIILENALLKAVFDRSTGALLNLTSKKTGWQVQRRSSLARSFRMLLPLPDRRNNPVVGEKQAPPMVETDNRQRLVFTWRNLHSEHGGGADIIFRGGVELSDDGLTFRAEVENRSPHAIETIDWPCLGDFSRPPGVERFEFLAMNYGNASRRCIFPHFNNSRGYWGTDYPVEIVASEVSPFVIIHGNQGGLYAGYHDTSMEQLLFFTFELRPGVEQRDRCLMASGDEMDGQPLQVLFYTTHFPFLNPGESGKLHPVVLRPYAGTWHQGADCYRQWRKTWYRQPPAPAWARDVFSWHQIHINSPEDELRFQYKDLVRYGADCARHGVQAIHLIGWNRGGQDRGNPSHDIDPRLGAWEDLRDAIAAIHAMGVKVILFNKYTWADRSGEWFRTDLARHAARDPYGDYYLHPGWQYQTPAQLADINTRRLVPLCMHSAQWREIAAREFRKSIALGADGMLSDEAFHHAPARYCFDPGHGHHVPAHIYAGDAPLAEEFRAIAARENPEFLFAAEACYDLQCRHYSISYMRLEENHLPLPRYVAQDTGIAITVIGYNDRNVINKALMYRYILSYEPRNFKGRLDEFPRTVAYGGQVDELRRRYREFLWDAEFCHTLGAAVAKGNAPMDEYGYSVLRHRQTGKRAVVVVNRDAGRAMEIAVKLDAPAADMVMVTPERPAAVESQGAAEIPPLSAAIFMEK